MMTTADRLARAHKNGFRFTVYRTVYRKRPYIVEVSAVRRSPAGIAGFSFQSCNQRQSRLRQIVAMLDSRKLPYRTEVA